MAHQTARPPDLIEFPAKQKTADEVTQDLLRAVVLRLDLLCALIDRDYEPPDDTSA